MYMSVLVRDSEKKKTKATHVWNRKCACQPCYNPRCCSYRGTAAADDDLKISQHAYAGAWYIWTNRGGDDMNVKKRNPYSIPCRHQAGPNITLPAPSHHTNAPWRKYLKGRAGVGQKCWHSEIALSDNICRVSHSQPVFSIQPWQRVGKYPGLIPFPAHYALECFPFFPE